MPPAVMAGAEHTQQEKKKHRKEKKEKKSKKEKRKRSLENDDQHDDDHASVKRTKPSASDASPSEDTDTGDVNLKKGTILQPKDLETSEVWLVRVPASVDEKDLDGKKIALDGSSDVELDGRTLRVDLEDVRSLAHAGSMRILAAKKGSSDLHAVDANVRGQLVCSETVEVPAVQAPKTSALVIQQPDGLDFALKAFGSTDVSASTSEGKMDTSKDHDASSSLDKSQQDQAAAKQKKAKKHRKSRGGEHDSTGKDSSKDTGGSSDKKKHKKKKKQNKAEH